jgi:esterase/lipase
LDNPVGVIANEVEALKRFQRSIRPFALTPGFLLRRMLAKRLQKQAMAEFEKDFKNYYLSETPRDRTAGRPFLVRGSFRKPAILLIHGYLAAPAEVRSLALYLGGRGFTVYAPRLKGHGTSPEDLAQRSLRVKFLSNRLAPALDAWNRLLKKIRIDDGEPEFVEIEPENPKIKYRRNPVTGIREVERLMGSLEPRLPDLKIPALVIQSLNDPVVDSEGSMQIFQLLGSEEKSYLIFDMDRHVIVGGEGAHRVHKAIGDFAEGVFQK